MLAYICTQITTTKKLNTMETLKQQYANQALIYNKNLKFIKTQLNQKKIAELKKEYNCVEDSHLAKITMLRGINLK